MVDDLRSPEAAYAAPAEDDGTRETSPRPARWKFVATAVFMGGLLVLSAALL
jgi:hypothetical protein